MGVHENGSANILVADDDEGSRDLLATLLRGEGHAVVCAEDGQKALDSLRDHRVDLALLDVLMPRASGFDVCQAMKAMPETRLIPVVLVTGLNSTKDRIRGIQCGADDFLSKPVSKEELLARVHSLLRIKHFTDELESAESVLCSLALSIEGKDPYTDGHCKRLAGYSMALASRLGLPEELQVALRRGATVHDIGKVAVPESILLKPGPLTPEERTIMQQHTIVGERICAPLKSFRHVLPIIRHHHEKQDGSGYPDGLRGEQIPVTARILQVVDIYDALSTDRPYRHALPRQEALGIMRDEAKRGWWDNSIIDEFEGVLQGHLLVEAS